MRDIMFLAHRVPFPPDRGDKIRSYHLLKAMAAFARVHLVAFVDEAAELAHAEALRPFVQGQLHLVHRTRSKTSALIDGLARGQALSLSLFDDPALRGHVDGVLREEEIATIFAFSGQMAQYVPEKRGDARFVMDFVDMDSAKFASFAQRASGPMRWIFAREAKRLAAFERATALRADLSTFVSEAEAELFRRTSAGANVAALENGIALDTFGPEADFERLTAPPKPMILFTGQMDYQPNVEAVSRFAREVLPALSGATFAIVGRAPTAEVRALAELPNVVVTGQVADTRGWLAAAQVVVAPLTIARGVQNKVLEAMAMGRAVVATPQAAEGIDAAGGRDLLIAPIAEQAALIAGLLADPDRAAVMGQTARARMIARYDWRARLAPLEAMLLP